jgi:hypothetical protein
MNIANQTLGAISSLALAMIGPHQDGSAINAAWLKLQSASFDYAALDVGQIFFDGIRNARRPSAAMPQFNRLRFAFGGKPPAPPTSPESPPLADTESWLAARGYLFNDKCPMLRAVKVLERTLKEVRKDAAAQNKERSRENGKKRPRVTWWTPLKTDIYDRIAKLKNQGESEHQACRLALKELKGELQRLNRDWRGSERDIGELVKTVRVSFRSYCTADLE